MQKRKPVFTKRSRIYIRKPHPPALPSSSAVLPALFALAKSRKTEVEALCRKTTGNLAAAQMLHYLLRWWKNKDLVRMTERDWTVKLGLTIREIRSGKKALQAAGVRVLVKAHQYGRATYYAINIPHFLKALKSAIGIAFTTILKALGVGTKRTDGSVQNVRMGRHNGERTNITESSTNLSHHDSDDDEKFPSSDSGEFPSEEKEGRDETQEKHDASRKYLEEHGVFAPALDEAAKHPLPKIERAFEIAAQVGATKPAAYALSVLQNGEYHKKPAWMNKLSGASGEKATERNSSAVKTDFQINQNPYAGLSWSDFAQAPEEAQEVNA